MKRVALLSDGWKRLVTYAWANGIIEGAHELGIDVSLFFFSTNGTWSRDAKFNNGEYNLYELPVLEEFDGIVFDCTNTIDKHQINRMVEKLDNVKVPVVSIGYDVDGFYYVGNDNKKLFRSVLDHLHDVHGCKSYAFAGGPDFNYENRMRFEAFRSAMKDYGVPQQKQYYLFGDYEFSTGVRYMDEWHESGREFPDVFVCANDNIAAGICSRASQLGYDVPEDFLVTGFDNLDKAAYFNPQITTVGHNRETIGMTALKMLNEIWNGHKDIGDNFLMSEFIPGESCGCPNNNRVDYRNYIKQSIEESVKIDLDAENVMILQNKIEECVDFESLFKEFTMHILASDCDGVYFCVDKTLLEAKRDGHFRKSGYDMSRIDIAYAYERDMGRLYFKSSDELKEYMDAPRETTHFMFYSIHFRDDIVGYMVLKNPRFLIDSPAFFDVHSAFCKKLENIYRQKKLENTNIELSEFYNRDSLTGLYNRVACNQTIIPIFEEKNRCMLGCTMIFFDVDDFKLINDMKGHRYGDEVLKMIAKTLENEKPKGSMVYRFGGDEFTVFIPYVDEKETGGFIERAEKKLAQRDIFISHGTVCTEPTSNKSFDDYMVMADKRMYEHKAKRKKERGENFLKGVDISSLPEFIDRGAKFYDANHKEYEAFEFLKANNINSVRLRIWNEPSRVPESHGYCDLRHTLDMARKIKKAGMHFMLDFHYSDFWADPGQQRKPHAWMNMNFRELKTAVYEYTAMVMKNLADIGCEPDMVQIGNEIRSGMLFPDGAVPNYDKLAQLVNAGIKAVRDTAPYTSVMIHLDQGGRFFYLREWFDAMYAAGMMPIDAIGISYYPFWHGTYMDLKETIEKLIRAYSLPVYIVETAHPWRHCEGEHVSKELMETSGLPAGIEEQKKSLEIIMQIAAESAVSYGKTGVYYWEPLANPNSGFGSWNENMGMFDDKFEALPAWEVYRDFDPMVPQIEDLHTYIRGLYKKNDDVIVPKGTNLIANGDFQRGLDGWWYDADPADLPVSTGPEGIYVRSNQNFKFSIGRQIYIHKEGSYTLSVDYRGTNTTGVEVELYIAEISADGEEVHTKRIFPSDVRYVTHRLEDVELKPGYVRVGVRMHTPPVFAKIKGFSLVAN